jgi:hypothetical protein
MIEEDLGQGDGGKATPYVDGMQVARAEVGRTMPGAFSLSETFDVGEDTGTPVSRDHTRADAFRGDRDRVVVSLSEQARRIRRAVGSAPLAPWRGDGQPAGQERQWARVGSRWGWE